MKFESKYNFHSRKCISKYRLQNGDHSVSASTGNYKPTLIQKWLCSITCIPFHDIFSVKPFLGSQNVFYNLNLVLSEAGYDMV